MSFVIRSDARYYSCLVYVVCRMSKIITLSTTSAACRTLNILRPLTRRQLKYYHPDPDLTEVKNASKSLYKIFRGFSVTMKDFTSCTTGSGSDVKVMTVNVAREHEILWD